MTWEFKNGIPIYLQIVNTLKMKIAGGDLPPGSQVRPVRDLAMEAGVNPNTMQRALTQLEQEGLLYTQRTSGRFVTEDAQVLRDLRASLSREHIRQMFDALGELGMSREEILEAVEHYS